MRVILTQDVPKLGNVGDVCTVKPGFGRNYLLPQGLAMLGLQTRVELVENQTAFRAMGFQEVGRTAHPGYDRPTSITYRRAVVF